MSALLLVLNVKATAFLAGLSSLRGQNLLKNLSSLIIFGSVAVGVFFLARGVTGYLIQQAHIGQFLYHRFLSMLLYVFFVTVNLGNMIVCYATLYRSEEVTFLMGLPISHEKIFLIKFVDNFFYSSGTLTLLGLSWLLGYGSFYYMPWYFYFFTMFAVLLPFMLIAGLLAVMVLMVLIKVAMEIGIRWLLALLVAVYLSAIYVYFKVTNPVQLVEEVMKHYPNVNQYFGYLDGPFARYLPNYWVSEFLYWSVHGDAARALPHLFTLIITLAALVVVAAFMARRYYYRSWLASSDARALVREQRVPLRIRLLEFGQGMMVRPKFDALVKRDVWLFLREPSQWLHLVLMILLLMIFVISLGQMELKLAQPLLQAAAFLVVFLFNGFLVASISLRFVFPAVSLEGDTFWAVRSAPVSLKRLYWYKFWLSFLLVAGVGELLAVASTVLLGSDSLLVSLAAVSTFFVALALTSVNLGAGSYFATYREKNPIRVASSQGASMTFLLALVFLATVVGVLVLPLTTYFRNLIVHGVATAGWVYLPVAIIAVISIVLFVVSTRIGVAAIQRDF